VYAYHEGMVDDAEDAVLIVDVVDLLRFDDLLLFHDLDAGESIGIALLDQSDFPEGT
jgi:hypothetical protein